MQSEKVSILLSNYGKESYEYLLEKLLELDIIKEHDIENAAKEIIKEDLE